MGFGRMGLQSKGYFCEHGNEHSGSKKGWRISYLNDNQIVKEDGSMKSFLFLKEISESYTEHSLSQSLHIAMTEAMTQRLQV